MRDLKSVENAQLISEPVYREKEIERERKREIERERERERSTDERDENLTKNPAYLRGAGDLCQLAAARDE